MIGDCACLRAGALRFRKLALEAGMQPERSDWEKSFPDYLRDALDRQGAAAAFAPQWTRPNFSGVQVFIEPLDPDEIRRRQLYWEDT